MSLNGIHLASRSLQAHALTLEVIGQNIVNAATPGYSRRIALPQAVAAPTASGLDSSSFRGMGVEVQHIERARALWLEQASLHLAGEAGSSATEARVAQQLERVFGEPGEFGLQATLDRFFSAFATLAGQPDDPSLRALALQSGQQLATRFNLAFDDLRALGQELDGRMAAGVERVNQLSEQIANLNRQIQLAQASGAAAHELQDTRFQLAQEFAQLTGATIAEVENGSLVVAVGGHVIVQDGMWQPLTITQGQPLGVALRASGQPVNFSSGELAGYQRWATSQLPEYRDQLTRFRDELLGQVNALHQSGRDQLDRPGEALFVIGNDGRVLVNPLVAADPKRLVTGGGSSGDGSLAQAIAGLRAAPQLLPQYRSLVASVGSEVELGRRNAERVTGLQRELRAQHQSEVGVNLDEELAQMVAMQQLYAASARLLSAYDEMLSTLIQRTGA